MGSVMMGIHESGWVSIITAVTTGLVAVLGAFFAGMAMLRSGKNTSAIDKNTDRINVNTALTRDTHEQVKTFNEMTLGQLGEATEQRRIEEIDTEDRTPREKRHVAEHERNQ